MLALRGTSGSLSRLTRRTNIDQPLRRAAFLREVAYVYFMIAFTSALAEAGTQYRNVFGPRRTGMGVEIYSGTVWPLLLHGRGTMWVSDVEGLRRHSPYWWDFLAYAAVAAVLVKSPLLLAPVRFGGMEIARRTRRWPLVATYAAGLVAGAVIGMAVFTTYLAVLNWSVPRRFWVIPHLAGFAGCFAGGACGALIVVGRGRRRGLAGSLFETQVIGLVVIATALVLRY